MRSLTFCVLKWCFLSTINRTNLKFFEFLRQVFFIFFLYASEKRQWQHLKHNCNFLTLTLLFENCVCVNFYVASAFSAMLTVPEKCWLTLTGRGAPWLCCLPSSPWFLYLYQLCLAGCCRLAAISSLQVWILCSSGFIRNIATHLPRCTFPYTQTLLRHHHAFITTSEGKKISGAILTPLHPHAASVPYIQNSEVQQVVCKLLLVSLSCSPSRKQTSLYGNRSHTNINIAWLQEGS